MYVGTVVSLREAYNNYLAKQKASIVVYPTHVTARLGDHTFDYQASEKWWRDHSGDFEPSPEVQAKLNALLKGQA